MKFFRKKIQKNKKRNNKKRNNKRTAKIFKPSAPKYFVLTFKSITSLIIFVFLVAGVIFFFQSEYFKVSDISCQKNNFPCSEKEKNLFIDLLGNNIFLVDTDKLANSIKEKNYWIGKIKIEKQLLNKVLIELIERKGRAGLTVDEKTWFIIDDQGFVFEQVSEKPKKLALIYLKNNHFGLSIGQRLNQEETEEVLAILKFSADNFIFLEKMFVDFNETITLFLGEDIVASLSSRKEASSQVDSLHFILRQSKIEGRIPKWIDLRFDKPVIKF